MIKDLHRQDVSISKIARRTERDRKTMHGIVIQVWIDGPRRPDEVDPRVRALALEMNGIALANMGVGKEMTLPPVVERLDAVHAPTLIVAGEVDTPRTLAAADLLARRLPDARKVVMPGLTHLLNMEQPEDYNRLVADFLRS